MFSKFAVLFTIILVLSAHTEYVIGYINFQKLMPHQTSVFKSERVSVKKLVGVSGVRSPLNSF